MENPGSEVGIEFVTSDGRIATTGGGALQIWVSEPRLNRYQHEDMEGSLYWKGYVGADIVADLINISDSTEDAVETATLYEPEDVHFLGYDDYLVLEQLCDDVLRIASHRRTSRLARMNFASSLGARVACRWRRRPG